MKFRVRSSNLVFRDCLKVRQTSGYLIRTPGQNIGGMGDCLWGFTRLTPTREEVIDDLKKFKKAYPNYRQFKEILLHPIYNVGIL